MIALEMSEWKAINDRKHLYDHVYDLKIVFITYWLIFGQTRKLLAQVKTQQRLYRYISHLKKYAMLLR